MDGYDVYIRLMVAAVLGAAIGFERQWHQGMAGIRTNALVALGSAIFVTVAVLTPSDAGATRVAGQVVTGIGFLGAGVIMRQGFSVTGLNTATTLWCASGVGVLAGQGYPVQATGGAVIVVISNIILRRLKMEGPANMRSADRGHYALRLTCTDEAQVEVRALLIAELANAPLALTGIQSAPRQSGRIEIRADIAGPPHSDEALESVIARLGASKAVEGIQMEEARQSEEPNGGGFLQ